MITALILHRKSDGKRVLVGVVGFMLSDDDDAWPYVETFDEIANALNAQHVTEDDDAETRATKARTEQYIKEGRCPDCGSWTNDRHEVINGNPCPRGCHHVMRTYESVNGEMQPVRCVRSANHHGEHDDDGLPF